MAAGFFYSKTFKIIATVILSVELIIIITLKVVDLYCDEPGCWNKKDWGTNYCMEHINSIYEEAMKRERAYENSQRKTVRVTAILTNPKEVILLEKRVLHRVHTIHTAILIPPGETILMMFIIMMIRMISPMTGLRNSVEEIMMADMMMRMITGRRTTGNNNTRKLWR